MLKQAEAGSSNNPLTYNSWNYGDVFTTHSFSAYPKDYLYMKKIWCFYFLLFYLCSCCNTPDNQTINMTLSSQGNVVVLNSETLI